MSKFVIAVCINLCSLVLILPAISARGQNRIYVDIDASGVNNGESWVNAFTDLQSALQIAGNGDEIWVAEGIYHPVMPASPTVVTDFEKSRSFRLLDGVGVFGGFSGVESTLDERDFRMNETILSGDLLDNDNNNVVVGEPTRTDNTWLIVKLGDLDLGTVGSNTVLDGFTISGGNADPPDLNPSNAGAAINIIGFGGDPSTPMLRNLQLTSNSSFLAELSTVFSQIPQLQTRPFPVTPPLLTAAG